MPEAAEVAVLCQGWLMSSESFLPPPGCGVPGEGQPEAAHIGGLLELCLPTLGHAAPGEGQPEAAQYQGGLRTASEELCLPTGCAAWRRSRLPETSREMNDREIFVHKMTQTAFLKAKEEFDNNVRTPSDEMCMPEAAVLCQGWLMISESFLPPPGRAAPGEGQPEAAHMGGLLELCLLTLGHAAPGGGQPEAAQYQGGLRTASEELCLPTGCAAWRRSRLLKKSREMDDKKYFIHKMTQTAFLKAKEEFNNKVGMPSDGLCMPEAAEVAVLCPGWLMISESFLPPPGCGAPGEGQPEAAHIGGLLESCLPTLGRAAPGEGQPEAAQYQGGLRTASEELCLPTGCAARRRSRLPETSGEIDDKNFFVYRLIQSAFLKANEEFSYNRVNERAFKQPEADQYKSRLRMPSDKLCMPEAAVLCQRGLIVASELCLPPGCAAFGEAQPAAQYQSGLRTASEESCLPPGGAAWRRSQLPETSREMDDRRFLVYIVRSGFSLILVICYPIIN
jgi:hypothetical protein